ncbi:MAG TPA: hypothetical protein VFH51_13805 [Myxococcota bacterium]|nr:hypothetical protein [Myxococcota bacterium]
MNERLAYDMLLSLLEDDAELVRELVAHGLLEAQEGGYLPEQAETARLAHTLIRDLDVNWEGVEIILNMRQELLATRRQMAQLLEYLQRSAFLPREPSI